MEVAVAGRTLAIGLIVALPLGCKSPSEAERAETSLQQAMADCTARTGYDPGAAALPERALAPGERAWRDCALLTTIVPKSSVPELYRGLIGDDERMTAALDAGTMTRGERRLRLETSIETIRAAEARAYEDRQAKLMQDMQAQAVQQRHQDDIYRITAQAAQMQRIMVAR